MLPVLWSLKVPYRWVTLHTAVAVYHSPVAFPKQVFDLLADRAELRTLEERTDVYTWIYL